MSKREPTLVDLQPLRVSSGLTLNGGKPLQMEASLFGPRSEAVLAPVVVLTCLSGGGMNRHYFDLMVGADGSFSFARQMARRGFYVLTLDHLGVGGSDRPADGFALTPDLLAQANVCAVGELLARLREGRLVPGVDALPNLVSIGVGHSMGAMMTVLQQVQARQHAAVALLGFSTRGLPEYVPADVVALPRSEQRARLPEFARRLFREPYPVIRSSGDGAQIYGSANAEPEGVAALKAATDHLLPVPAFMSMLPGNVAPEAAQIDVPVFLGLGECDMAGEPRDIPAAFPASPEVTLYIQPDAGHSHFLFPSRTELFERLGDWAASVAVQRKQLEESERS